MDAVVAGGVLAAGAVDVVHGNPVAAFQPRPVRETPAPVETVLPQKLVPLREENHLNRA